MKNKSLATILTLLVLVSAGFVIYQAIPNSKVDSGSAKHNDIVAMIYKSPTCGCCGVYASYMQREGYDVQIKNVQAMADIRQELGVPYELESCHTMEIGGYVVEGHIPQEAIARLLIDKPDIKGIGMAGMPSGSPGMPGPKTDPFVIYEITVNGEVGEIYMTI